MILAAPFFATNGVELEEAADEHGPPAAPMPVAAREEEEPVRELARSR